MVGFEPTTGRFDDSLEVVIGYPFMYFIEDMAIESGPTNRNPCTLLCSKFHYMHSL